MQITKRAFLPLNIVLLCIFVLILVFTSLTPLIADDFSYSFSWSDGTRISSLFQIIDSMAVHREILNGRVFAHAIVQTMLMLPKLVFNFLNAFNCLLLCFLFKRFFLSREPRATALLLACGALLFWNFMPAFGQVFLWLDGSINYSWGISFFLLYVWPYAADYLGIQRKKSLVADILFLVVALIAGSYSENGSIAVIFISLCLSVLIIVRDKRISWPLLVGLALACAGFLFLISAPATGGRAGGMDISSIVRNVKAILLSAKEQLLVLYILYAALLAACLLIKADPRRIILSAIFVLAGIGSLASFSFALYFATRHFCFTVFFTILAILILLDAIPEKNRKKPASILCAVLSVLFVFNFALGALDVGVVFIKSLERRAVIETALAEQEPSVELEIYGPSTKYAAAFGFQELSEDEAEWPNVDIAKYYGLEKVRGYLKYPSADGQ